MKKILFATAASALLVAGCATDGTMQRPSDRVLIGAGSGAVVGAGLGTLAGGDDGRNAAIGAVVGAIAGGAVGGYMDRQEERLRAQTAGTGIEVERRGDQIYLNTPADITFALSSADIQSSFYPTLNDLAATLREFPSTAVDIVGHASTDGPEQYNMDLSERRAVAVQTYLNQQGVRPVRMAAYGRGESQPIPGIPGESPQNRRVEIVLTPITEGNV
ncbi:MAG: hypothetical protein CMK07_15055 [Ponticaulis sp.]|nr:hypothetical protein [Ponticaulis sp.]